ADARRARGAGPLAVPRESGPSRSRRLTSDVAVAVPACDPWLSGLVALDGLADGARVVVGCSGGADSVALLAMSCALGLDTVAVYVDHGLRAGTTHEAAAVALIAGRLGATPRVEVVDVAPGANLEERARDARYAALERARADVDACAILVAHTRDDQAETVLMHRSEERRVGKENRSRQPRCHE